MNKEKISISSINEDEETETRLALLEGLIQTKNKEIESCQKRICDYNRLKEDFMSSQHKLIGLQTKYDRVLEENKKLRKQIKLINTNVTKSDQGKSYSKIKHSKIVTKSSQTSNEDFQAAAYQWYHAKADEDKTPLANTFTAGDVQSGYQQTGNVEKDVASELVKEITVAASEVAREQYLASMVYEETSGLYYDYKTGYYFDSERSLFYDGNRFVVNHLITY